MDTNRLPIPDPEQRRPSFVAYIDESGDEGFRFERNSSRWFVLGAAIFRQNNELEEVKLVDEVREEINRVQAIVGSGKRFEKKQPLHFKNMKHEQRRYFTTRIAKAHMRWIGILMDKTLLTTPEVYKVESRLYFYSVRLLIERISWFCRDHHHSNDPGDGSARLVFSNRGGMNYNALRNYLRYLEQNRVALGYQGAEGVIRPELLETYSPGRRMGLQIADAVASSLFHAVNPNHYGMVETGYLRALYSLAYRYKGSVWGYGLKLMPREAEEKRRAGQILEGFE